MKPSLQNAEFFEFLFKTRWIELFNFKKNKRDFHQPYLLDGSCTWVDCIYVWYTEGSEKVMYGPEMVLTTFNGIIPATLNLLTSGATGFALKDILYFERIPG